MAASRKAKAEPSKPLSEAVREEFEAAPDKQAFLEELRALLHELSPQGSQPIDLVRWIPVEDIAPNDYNPNAVARVEMKLLYTSILHDGYTQPIVAVRDPATGKAVIVDGFHRYFIGKNNADISGRTGGRLPVVFIEKSITERMASTVRHNRARGKHSVEGMSSMIFEMLDKGMDDATICNELGMEAEEITRLKHLTGFSKLFEDVEYKRAWMVRRQIAVRKAYENGLQKVGEPVGGTGKANQVRRKAG